MSSDSESKIEEGKEKLIQKNAYIVTMNLKPSMQICYWFVTPFEAYASKRKYMY